jgi:hypothetical protein
MSSGVRSDATLPIESTHQALASPAHVSVPIASARSDICQTSFGFFGQNLGESDSFFLRVEARSLDLVTVGLEHDEIGSAFPSTRMSTTRLFIGSAPSCPYLPEGPKLQSGGSVVAG